MKEILNGLAVMGGLIVMVYALVFILGVVVIFIHNLFGSHHEDYDWINIRHFGGGAIIGLIVIILILSAAYIIGSIRL